MWLGVIAATGGQELGGVGHVMCANTVSPTGPESIRQGTTPPLTIAGGKL